MSFVDDAIAAAHRAGIDPSIFVRQIQQESGFNPNARSPAGAEGIAQFMPGTARGLGINPWNPVQALNAAAQYMANSLRSYGGDYAKALAAYNAGGGAVSYAISRGGSNWRNFLPTETQNYIKVIMGGKRNPLPIFRHHAEVSGPPVSSGHTPLAQPGRPYAFSVPQQQTPKPKTIFGIPVTLSVVRHPSAPVAKQQAARPAPKPKPAPKKLPRGIS